VEANSPRRERFLWALRRVSTSKDSTTDDCDSLLIACWHQDRDTQLVLTLLLVSNGFDSELIVVDLLTRIAHFMPCRESVTAEETATLFLHGIYRLHGLPRVLGSDRGPKLVNGL
jgi:hypothetical protein